MQTCAYGRIYSYIRFYNYIIDSATLPDGRQGCRVGYAVFRVTAYGITMSYDRLTELGLPIKILRQFRFTVSISEYRDPRD